MEHSPIPASPGSLAEAQHSLQVQLQRQQVVVGGRVYRCPHGKAVAVRATSLSSLNRSFLKVLPDAHSKTPTAITEHNPVGLSAQLLRAVCLGAIIRSRTTLHLEWGSVPTQQMATHPCLCDFLFSSNKLFSRANILAQGVKPLVRPPSAPIKGLVLSFQTSSLLIKRQTPANVGEHVGVKVQNTRWGSRVSRSLPVLWKAYCEVTT